jgi:hypothetical protein
LNSKIEESFAAFKATRVEVLDMILSDKHAMREDFEFLRFQTAEEVKLMRKRYMIGFLTTFGT